MQRAWVGLCLGFMIAALAPAAAQEPLAVQTVDFEAASVGRTMRYNIVLPAQYESSEKRYPVLYLLHGLTSNYAAWAGMGVPRYAAALELIVVMPDVGNSWYVNWAENDEGQANAWEDFIAVDLIEHVDGTYRTIARREGRAINGLSMGGYGALMVGLRNPELFCSIGSHSGALEYASGAAARLRRPAQGRGGRRGGRRGGGDAGPDFLPEGFRSQAQRTPAGSAFATAGDADAYDPFKLVLAVPKEDLPHIHLDCGTEDRLIAGAQRFMNLLMENTIPFSYAQSPGGHSGPYWTREVEHSMAVQYGIIQRSLRGGGR